MDITLPNLDADVIKFSDDSKLNIFRYLTILCLVWSSVKAGRKCDEPYIYKLLYYLEHDMGLLLDYRYNLDKDGLHSPDVDYDLLALSSLSFLTKFKEKKYWVYSTNESSLGYLQNYPGSVKQISEVIKQCKDMIKDFPLSKVNRIVTSLYIKKSKNNVR